jgi:hypothetical protein
MPIAALTGERHIEQSHFPKDGHGRRLFSLFSGLAFDRLLFEEHSMGVTELTLQDSSTSMRLGSRWLWSPVISLLLIVPCLWQPIVSSGDLQSHIYNAWLAELIRSGSIHGLWIGHQSTNLLLDILFPWLLRVFGVSGAERVAASACVLVFFWGAFFFISVFSKRHPYWLMPWLAILTYGYAFQQGILNYYLSCGIIFWTLTLLWKQPLGARTFLGVILLALAYLAHPLPVLWVLGISLYGMLARRLRPGYQVFLFLAGALILFLLRIYTTSRFLTVWLPRQTMYWTGADQALLWGWLYIPVFLGFLLFSVVLLSEPENRWKAVSSITAQVYFLTGLAIVLLPTAIRRSVTDTWASCIAERFSLLPGVLLLAILARSVCRRWYLPAGVLAAGIFFIALYRDIGREARVVAKLHELVATIPAGERVVSWIDGPPSGGESTPKHFAQRALSVFTERINSTHLLSRACLGHCFDYVNYEPSTGQFRIHAVPGNAVVLATWPDVDHMNTGEYLIKLDELPLYAVLRCGPALEDLVLVSMSQGQTGATLVCPGVLNTR